MRSVHVLSRWGARNRPLKAVIVAISILNLCSACTLIRSALELPDKAFQAILPFVKKGETADPVELQSQLIRFADHYLDAFYAAAGRLREQDGQPLERRAILQRRISVTNDVLGIATGSNAFASLLDMVILVTLNRMNIEDFWLPKRFGESAKPLLFVHQEAEKEIWRIAATVLEKDQLDELRSGIQAWHEQHPDGRSPRDVGALGFASEIAKMNRSAQARTSSVFNLLMIDPLSGLDPATQELANTRLFAERGVFLARHMPTLIRWEMALLAVQTAEMPQVENLLASSNQLSQAVDRFSQVSERLPAVIKSERQNVVEALRSERPGLTSLAEQTKEALAAGKLMSDATNQALKTFQDVVTQLESSPSSPDSEPFRIRDYTAAAVQISTTAQRLAELLQAFDQTIRPENLDAFSARMGSLTQQAQASGKDVVDYAFRKALLLGLILIALGCAMAVMSVLVYWRLKKRFAGKSDREP
jgi:hypothetical protein